MAAASRLGELFDRLPLADQPLLADLVPFYSAWTDTPGPRAPLWRDGVVDHSRIDVPALVSTGGYDYFLDASIEHCTLLHGDSRLTVGPWTHFTHDRDICGRDHGERASQDAVDWTGVHLGW
ncbi:CocE/NonD family hydrolase [Nonomuraea sp. PA05]|uniref:CocE/NonD family hydrolase n=1 Tax=Nonomuraea sp. PA05 TaxID=2604466 RepID=UPI00398394EA